MPGAPFVSTKSASSHTQHPTGHVAIMAMVLSSPVNQRFAASSTARQQDRLTRRGCVLGLVEVVGCMPGLSCMRQYIFTAGCRLGVEQRRKMQRRFMEERFPAPAEPALPCGNPNCPDPSSTVRLQLIPRSFSGPRVLGATSFHRKKADCARHFGFQDPPQAPGRKRKEEQRGSV